MAEHAERTAVPHGKATAMRKPGLRPRDDGPPQFPHLLREFRACALPQKRPLPNLDRPPLCV